MRSSPDPGVGVAISVNSNCLYCVRSNAFMLSLLASIGYAPNGFRAIVRDEQRPIGGYGYADRTAPHMTVVHDKTGHEVLEFSRGAARPMEWNTYQLITHTNRFVPGTVFRGENVALIFSRKLLAVVKADLQR